MTDSDITAERHHDGTLTISATVDGRTQRIRMSAEAAHEVGKSLLEMSVKEGAKPDQKVWRTVTSGPRHNA